MKTDFELQQDVMEEIKWDPRLKNVAAEIGVSAHDGVVTLLGMVETYSQKLAAEQAAQRVAGVRVVAVDVTIKLERTNKRTDTDIAEAVSNALKWHSAVNEDLIKIKVENGWVYLDGVVEWDYQKKAAETAVQDLIGVMGVINRIVVKSKEVDAIDIRRKISAAFHRNAAIDLSNIEIEVAGNRVILRGRVRSWAEKREAENVAWSSPGVVGIDNKIEVQEDSDILITA